MEEVNEGSESEDKSLFQEVPEEGGGGGGDNVLRHRLRPSSSSRITLDSVSKMLRKKSGLFMLPGRHWMQTVPTQDCEVVVSFSPGCSESSVNWLLNLFKSRIPDLVFMFKKHLPENSSALYVTATMNGLIKGAEDLHLMKKTKKEYGNGLREVNHDELQMFQGVDDPSTFFTSQERQLIIVHLLNSLRGVEGDQINAITFREGQAIVPKLRTDGIIEQILPLHDEKILTKLRTSWVQNFFRYQPLDLIQDYFGPKIGIYFSWLGFYTASLTVPAIIGLFFWINFWGKDQAQEDKAFVVIAFLNVVWGSMWLEAWKRRSAELTHRWGLQDYSHELLQDPRPEFIGDLKVSPVTGRIEPTYPSYKRNIFRYFVTIPVILCCLGLVFVAMFIFLQLQHWVDNVILNRGLPSFLSYCPKFGMAMMISVFDEAYSKIAFWLNDKENYRQEETYQNHMIIKLTIFRLVNSFLVLFYIAFYLQDMEILKAQLAALFVTRQIIGNIKESFVPYMLQQIKLATLIDVCEAITPTAEEGTSKDEERDQEENKGVSCRQDGGRAEQADGKLERIEEKPSVPASGTSNKNRMLTQAEIECTQGKYEDTFEDYLEMFIQFGYVMLFSSAFPLAAICALVNNLCEIRSDAFKLCSVHQRPFGQRVHGIGVWQDAMELMCLLGIMVNCMLIGLSGQVHRMFPEMSTTQTILLIIVLEHIMIALKYGISYVIPDEPEWIIEEIAKAEFQRRDALKKLSSSTSPPTRESSEQSSPKSSCQISNLPSMEYIEKSVQTDHTTSNSSRQSSIDNQQPVAMPEDRIVMDFRTDYKPPKPSVNLGRSVSAGERVKHCIPSVSKRWNHSGSDNFSRISSSSGSLNPNVGESMPTLSAPANFDNKKRLFNFAPPENVNKESIAPSPDKESIGSSRSRSADSMGSSTIKEGEVLQPTAEYSSYKEAKQSAQASRQISFSSHGKRKKNFPSVESLSSASHSESSAKKETFKNISIQEIPKWKNRVVELPPPVKPIVYRHVEAPRRESKPEFEPIAIKSEIREVAPVEAIMPTAIMPTVCKPQGTRIGKMHPVKLLKRAQSFSQVFGTFKKPSTTAERKKKTIDRMNSVRDEYQTISREPLGELALVPLEKLVSIADIQNRSMTIDEEP